MAAGLVGLLVGLLGAVGAVADPLFEALARPTDRPRRGLFVVLPESYLRRWGPDADTDESVRGEAV